MVLVRFSRSTLGVASIVNRGQTTVSLQTDLSVSLPGDWPFYERVYD